MDTAVPIINPNNNKPTSAPIKAEAARGPGVGNKNMS